jgi:hypothetical protein
VRGRKLSDINGPGIYQVISTKGEQQIPLVSSTMGVL